MAGLFLTGSFLQEPIFTRPFRCVRRTGSNGSADKVAPPVARCSARATLFFPSCSPFRRLNPLRYADKTRGKPRSIGLRADAYGFSFFLSEKFDCGQLIYKSPPSRPLRSLLKPKKLKNSLYSCILTKINFCSVSV